MANNQSHEEEGREKSTQSSSTQMINAERNMDSGQLQSIKDINVISTHVHLENHEKPISETSTANSNKNNLTDHAIASPFDSTNESTRCNDTQNDSLASNPTENHPQNGLPIKITSKSCKYAIEDHSTDEHGNVDTRQRSLSSSSSSSADSSESSDHQTSNIPYQTLYDDDDDDLPDSIKETSNELS